MAAPVKYSFLAVMLVLLGLAACTQMVAAQDCSDGLGRLTVCAPYVVPGATNGPPSDACCSAIKTVDQGCLCNTINIINRLPSTCNLPQVTCGSA